LNVGWTLNYEMFFYLLFSLVFTVPQRHRPLIVAAALFAVSEVLGRYGVISRFYQNNIVYEFLLGIGIGVMYRRGWITEGLWVPLAVIAASVFAIYQLDASDRLLHWGLPSAMVVLACVAMEPHFKRVKMLKVLGDCSYSVYLVHVLVLYVGWLASVHWNLNPYVVFAVCVPLIALLSWGSYVLIEKRLYHRVKGWADTRFGRPAAAPIT
jgi:peptidoglycan/LPS O-acetylase OafA/YrhL